MLVLEFFQPAPRLDMEFFGLNKKTYSAITRNGTSFVAAVIGPKGEKGDPGAGSGTLVSFRAVLNSDGQQTLSLGHGVGVTRMLFINGLLQSDADFSIAGQEVSLSAGLSLLVGDVVHFLYSQA
jgi:hypothetical protein